TGAFAVLFSTFLVALASQARMYTDALKVWGLMGEQDPVQHDRVVAAFGAVLPLVCLALYWGGLDPVGAVLLSGTMQALMLPLLAFSALYFRYKCSDPRLAPSRSWDAFLIISSIGMLIAGGWGAYQQITGK